MYKLILLSIGCFALSILLFLKYNSGLGGPLGSFRKKATLLISFLLFLAFVVFLNMTFYYNSNKETEQTSYSILKNFTELEEAITIYYCDSSQTVSEKQEVTKKSIIDLQNEPNAATEVYVGLINGIIGAFIFSIIVFGFKNRLIF